MKIEKRNAFFALLATLVISALAAQHRGEPSPSPSRLRLSVKENLIVLTWNDSPDTKGKYLVYRSERPFSAETFSAATRLGEVATGAQTYTDTPPDSKPYFYAVLALADTGLPYQVYIPAKNTTSVSVAIGETASPGPRSTVSPALVAASSPAPVKPEGASISRLDIPPASQTIVSDLNAKTKGDAIVLAYKSAAKSRLVLYRGTLPILGAADLLDATLVAAFMDRDGTFVDFPVPGVEYYYAILGEEDLKSGRIKISAGINSLNIPAYVKPSAVSSGLAETPPSSRTPPLPYFLMEDGSSGGNVAAQDEGPPPARPVSSETEKAIAALLAKTPKLKPAMPATRILPEELASPSGGEDYALSIIVADRIAAKDWAGAASQLRKYLSLNRSPKSSARARFYLGEALVFTGSGREAFFEFLIAREFYPLETRPWIEYVLSTLRQG